MPRLKALTGDAVVAILRDFGYEVEGSRRCLLKLRKPTGHGASQALTFPSVKDMDRLTLAAVFHAVRPYVQEQRLRRRFYDA